LQNLPQFDIPVSGEDSSTTQAAIAEGVIRVADTSSVEAINRDTKQALNELHEIFDKTAVEEKQALANAISRQGFKLVGDIAMKKQRALIDKYVETMLQADATLKNGDNPLFATLIKKANGYRQEAKKWEDGGIYKIALHGVTGAIVSDVAGTGLKTGFVSAAANESLQGILGKIKNPELHKLASAIVGKLVVDNTTGQAIAQQATKYNWMAHEDQQYLMNNINEFFAEKITKEQFIEKLYYYVALDLYYSNGNNVDNIDDNLLDNSYLGIILTAANNSNRPSKSLAEIFEAEEIDTSHGFAYAFKEYAKKYGVPYDASNEKIKNYIAFFSATRPINIPRDDFFDQSSYTSKREAVINKALGAKVIDRWHQKSDGRYFEQMSDGTVRGTNEYVGVENFRRGMEVEVAETSNGKFFMSGGSYLPVKYLSHEEQEEVYKAAQIGNSDTYSLKKDNYNLGYSTTTNLLASHIDFMGNGILEGVNAGKKQLFF